MLRGNERESEEGKGTWEVERKKEKFYGRNGMEGGRDRRIKRERTMKGGRVKGKGKAETEGEVEED